MAVAEQDFAVGAGGNLVGEVPARVGRCRGHGDQALRAALCLHLDADRRPGDRITGSVDKPPDDLRRMVEGNRYLFVVGACELCAQRLAAGYRGFRAGVIDVDLPCGRAGGVGLAKGREVRGAYLHAVEPILKRRRSGVQGPARSEACRAGRGRCGDRADNARVGNLRDVAVRRVRASGRLSVDQHLDFTYAPAPVRRFTAEALAPAGDGAIEQGALWSCKLRRDGIDLRCRQIACVDRPSWGTGA